MRVADCVLPAGEESTMDGSQANQIEREAAVWVWDGTWWPATVTNATVDRGERLLIVRFEHGVTAPALPTDLEPRDPDLRGTDKPVGTRAI